MEPTLSQAPIVKVEMLIRKPVNEVFTAFVDPAITTQFWFTKGSAKLEAGSRVQWDWEIYGASADIDVLEIVENSRIVIDWGSRVEWTFAPRGDDATFVTIVNDGFEGSGDELVHQATDSTEGFTIVLCGLKAYLEHGIRLNLIGDKAPDAHVGS
ncbi:SRPBCC family protein [Paenibacillus sp. LHD-117]|uniref:SRPBCC family protein n=1 Tax=Paenibacillus sp. LHD-117 TaxID=3071412 RepID=UPI0027E0A4EE|nr:SRPBCC family protein [Paenibacillus sp. LHD-117]MDQ6418898.1 SRPBCC family protein [Paenibacillus sp. LHD-117]